MSTGPAYVRNARPGRTEPPAAAGVRVTMSGSPIGGALARHRVYRGVAVHPAEAPGLLARAGRPARLVLGRLALELAPGVEAIRRPGVRRRSRRRPRSRARDRAGSPRTGRRRRSRRCPRRRRRSPRRRPPGRARACRACRRCRPHRAGTRAGGGSSYAGRDRRRGPRPWRSASVPSEGVHERRLADARAAEDGRGPAGPAGARRASSIPTPVMAEIARTGTPGATAVTARTWPSTSAHRSALVRMTTGIAPLDQPTAR